MTNIILKIEKANEKNRNFMRDNAQAIVDMCNTLYAPKMGDEPMKTDDYREWMMKEHPEFAAYIYDEMGKPNSKGVCKPTMSQHKKNIMQGVKTVATRNDGFLEWANSDAGQETTTLAKVTGAVNKYFKAPTEPTGEGEGEEGETDNGITLEDMAREIIKKVGHDDALKLSELIYDMACAEASPEAVEATA